MSDKAKAPALSPETMMAFLERAAKDPHFDVAKFQALLAEQREERRELARAAYNRAMANAQEQMQLVLRDKPNTFLKSFYTSHRALYEMAHPKYTEQGFSLSYGTAEPPHQGWLRVTLEIAHRDGHEKQIFLDSPLHTTGSQGGRTAMTPVQAIGATITYLRKYLLMMAFNLVPDEAIMPADQRLDDDGEHQRRAARMPAVAPQSPLGPPEDAPAPTNGRPKLSTLFPDWLPPLQAAQDQMHRVSVLVGLIRTWPAARLKWLAANARFQSWLTEHFPDDAQALTAVLDELIAEREREDRAQAHDATDR